MGAAPALPSERPPNQPQSSPSDTAATGLGSRQGECTGMATLAPRTTAGTAYLHDLQHLLPADVAVAIQVVHAEGPHELLLQLPAGGDAQRDDELSEVDGAVAVLVEGAEGVLGKLGGVTIGKKLWAEERGERSERGGELTEQSPAQQERGAPTPRVVPSQSPP